MDIIDKDTLKREFMIQCTGQCNKCTYYNSDIKKGEGNQCKLIDVAPTITVKKLVAEMPNDLRENMLKRLRPNGEWVRGRFNLCECSNCHQPPITDSHGYVKTDFCPNCGAQMNNLTVK